MWKRIAVLIVIEQTRNYRSRDLPADGIEGCSELAKRGELRSIADAPSAFLIGTMVRAYATMIE